MNRISQRLTDLGIVLPTPSVPPAAYSAFHRHAGLVTISGQPPYENGLPKFYGKVGADRTLEEGYAAARTSMLNVLAHLEIACDRDLSRVIGCVRLLVMVSAHPDFHDVHQVANGASELIIEIFEHLPAPPRSSFGCAVLPMNITTEVEASFLIRVAP
jgi:enamine deaminase RidA (YjgF/YER057c/UK114 family)